MFQKQNSFPESTLTWEEIEVIFRKQCKDRSSVQLLKAFLRNLLHKAASISENTFKSSLLSFLL